MRPRNLLLLVALFLICRRPALADPPLEYQVKALCVLNAARFVSWPASSFSSAESPFVIGILGENPFGTILQEAVKGETLQKRRIVVRRVTLPEAGAGCHVLFVSRSERDHLEAIFHQLGDASVLAVSEIEGFAKNGGALGLTLIREKIRFQVNPEAARRARLKIDSQFLMLAEIVK